MANIAKQAIFRALVEGIITDLMIRTNVENVLVDESTTLAAKLAEIIASLNGKAPEVHTHAQSDVTGLSDALTERPTTTAMNSAISTAISDLIGGAPETYDTLKEISDYIAAHGDVVDALNAAIGNKVDKVDGKGLSANDFTDAMKAAVEGMGALASKSKVAESDLDADLAEKVNAAAEGNHSHSNKNVLDVISEEKVNTWDGKSKVFFDATQPANLTEKDLWVQIVN